MIGNATALNDIENDALEVVKSYQELANVLEPKKLYGTADKVLSKLYDINHLNTEYQSLASVGLHLARPDIFPGKDMVQDKFKEMFDAFKVHQVEFFNTINVSPFLNCADHLLIAQ